MEAGVGEVVITDANEVHYLNGRYVRGMTMVVAPEVMEQFKQGYRCLKCLEPFGGQFAQPAMPEECAVCGYEVRKLQLQELQKIDVGEVEAGPTPLSVIDDAFEEGRELERWKKQGSILVPRGFEEGA